MPRSPPSSAERSTASHISSRSAAGVFAHRRGHVRRRCRAASRRRAAFRSPGRLTPPGDCTPPPLGLPWLLRATGGRRVGVAGRCHARLDAELDEDALQVFGHRAGSRVQDDADLRVGRRSAAFWSSTPPFQTTCRRAAELSQYLDFKPLEEGVRTACYGPRLAVVRAPRETRIPGPAGGRGLDFRPPVPPPASSTRPLPTGPPPPS